MFGSILNYSTNWFQSSVPWLIAACCLNAAGLFLASEISGAVSESIERLEPVRLFSRAVAFHFNC